MKQIRLRLISAIIALASLGSIVYGFAISKASAERSQKFIGVGTVGLFLVAMPVFLISESRKKKLKDYMLTHEKIQKMKENQKKKDIRNS